ncbi:MAG TPA: flagellar biosynthetic protein FliR [Solimonas sp.]
MITVTDTQLLAWLQQYFWPFVRIGALFMLAPVLGARNVPARIRLGLAAAITLIVAPLLPVPAPLEMFSGLWWRTLFEQLAIGLCMGFTLLLVFEAVVLGGELIAYSMGLSFAQLADPLRGVSTPVVGQFLLIVVTLLFLALGGHLIVIELMLRSFRSLPVAAGGFGSAQLGALLTYSGTLFAGGVLLGLPVVTALLLANLALGVIGRSAPSLNLFAVGFPVTLMAGLLLLRAGLPAMAEQFGILLDSAWALIAQLGSAAPP